MSQPFKLQGVEEVLAKLETVKQEAKGKSARFALRKAAQLVLASAKSGAQAVDNPKTPNNIASNLVIRLDGKRFKKTGDHLFKVGVLGGAKQYAETKDNVRKGRVGKRYAIGGSKKNPGGDTFYWRFLEFGTAKMPPKPFMRKALASNIDSATQEFSLHFKRAIDRAVKRAEKGKTQ
ncbi:hypothetical protein AKN87_01835 [Thiopseudomonas alkaliphila]|uniref:HK97 gp10 family phage protein n=1 Tax=Thiopseudomonas alkaliphila TaxID=1697053 RepID=A0A0K1XH14_9GAMM|nr:HK97-gp10 family putative phage morphogenesis protein [Thiopseudomonas alkaliphila]AKX43988.1 hypothetical protein AKN87_01835 [Thiopseudomonas alkaliphila]AKX52033.1 hypothetical protein AKN92_11520 [Thiopseudomonas alkaliphila]AKX60472.1 hypothetical protein AKN88_11445 [Thiopseudomonas alkaliphila]